MTPTTLLGQDTSRVAFTSDRDRDFEIYVMQADGSGLVNLTNNRAADQLPAWSPDGGHISFQSFRDGNGQIYVMDADGSGQTNLTNNPGSTSSWSPDGTRIAFASYRNVKEEGGSCATSSDPCTHDIYVMNADGTNQVNISNTGLNVEARNPDWSPDGTKIAFDYNPSGGQTHDIYVVNPDGTNRTRLTTDPERDQFPAWSPDGTKIAFASHRDGNYEIYVMNADGTNQVRLTSSGGFDGGPAWSPDGTKIAFQSFRDGNNEIYVMNADGTGIANLTNNSASDFGPAWSAGTSESIPPDTIIDFAVDRKGNPILSGVPTVSTSITFTFSGTDNVGVAGFACSLDDADFFFCKGAMTFNGLAATGHTFQVRSFDISGNSDSTPASFSWTVFPDITPPETTIVSAVDGKGKVVKRGDSTRSSSIAFGFTGDDDDGVAGFECSLDAGAFSPCGNPTSINGLGPGDYDFQVRSVDFSGNSDPTPESFGWTVLPDLTPPDTIITSAVDGDYDPVENGGSTFSNFIRFEFIGSDDNGVAGFECSLNAAPFSPCESPTSFYGLAAGDYNFQVRSVDFSGNSDPTPASLSWTILLLDTTITSAVDGKGVPVENGGSTRSNSITFEFTGTADLGVAGFECRMIGSPFTACTSSKHYTRLGTGRHTFTVRAVDISDNVDHTPAWLSWNKGGGPTYGAIMGTVRDSTGLAISGAIVTADTGQSDTTDTYGWYRLDGVPTGIRNVTASATGYVALSQQTTVRDGGGIGLYFTLEPDPTYVGTGTIKGKITDANTGKNLAGVLVETDTDQSATTGKSGRYTIENVPEGETRTLTASKTGYVTQESPLVTVIVDQTTTVNFALTPMPTVS